MSRMYFYVCGFLVLNVVQLGVSSEFPVITDEASCLAECAKFNSNGIFNDGVCQCPITEADLLNNMERLVEEMQTTSAPKVPKTKKYHPMDSLIRQARHLFHCNNPQALANYFVNGELDADPSGSLSGVPQPSTLTNPDPHAPSAPEISPDPLSGGHILYKQPPAEISPDPLSGGQILYKQPCQPQPILKPSSCLGGLRALFAPTLLNIPGCYSGLGTGLSSLQIPDVSPYRSLLYAGKLKGGLLERLLGLPGCPPEIQEMQPQRIDKRAVYSEVSPLAAKLFSRNPMYKMQM